MIHITCKIHVNQPFRLSVKLLVNSRLLVVEFWGSRKLRVDFRLGRGLVPLPPMLFKGQQYWGCLYCEQVIIPLGAATVFLYLCLLYLVVYLAHCRLFVNVEWIHKWEVISQKLIGLFFMAKSSSTQQHHPRTQHL